MCGPCGSGRRRTLWEPWTTVIFGCRSGRVLPSMGARRPPLGGFFDAVYLRAGAVGALRAERELRLAGRPLRSRWQRDVQVGIDERGHVVGDGDAALLGGRGYSIGDLGGQACDHQSSLALTLPAAVAMPALSRHAGDPSAP